MEKIVDFWLISIVIIFGQIELVFGHVVILIRIAHHH